ncbi:MAG TPA: pyridoxamine 5'-phosphate oxidase family protein [Candidatus Acidoferrales bacterium]|nr:pyridoxamine 5'-phosphate oxidase family protein [Candidatus Acidoferrales bacterium]
MGVRDTGSTARAGHSTRASARVTPRVRQGEARIPAEPVEGTPAEPPHGAFAVTPRTEVRRADRASYERAVVYAILDEALVSHVGFAIDGTPFVIPMLHGRVGDTLFLHGLPATRLIRHLGHGAPACVEATLLDGLVMARSSFHHSLNYRSAVVLGTARLVRDPIEKLAGLRAIVEHVAPGRWDDARRPSRLELRQTHVVAVPIEEASAKVRTGPPADDPRDLLLPVWAGVIPVETTLGAPSRVGVDGVAADLPGYLARLVGRHGAPAGGA